MKRRALYLGIPYILGLSLASAVTSALWIAVLGGIAAAAAIVLIRRRELWKYVLLSTLSCLTACCVYWYADASVQPQMQLAGEEQSFTGQVTQRAVYPSGWTRYYLDGAFASGETARVEWFTELSSYGYGDTLSLAGTPTLPESSYLFDGVSFRRANRVFLLFDADTRITAYHPLDQPSLRRMIWDWRERMTARIQAQMGEETGAMLTGMLFGDKSGMTYSSRTALNRTGIGHVLAVSGLHLDFLALAAAFLLKKLKAGRKTTFAAIAMLCLMFVICAGETVSVKRACIMILLSQSARVLYRQADPFNSLSIALLYLGVENPFVVCGANFWLTASATFGIAVLGPYMTKDRKQDTVLQGFVCDVLCFCWAFVALFPVQILVFREISLLSPVSNTLLVPVCIGSMLFGVLALLCGAKGLPAALFLGGADVMNGWILSVSRAVSRLSWTHAATGSRILLQTFAAGAVLVFLVHLLCKNRRLTSVCTAGVLLVTALSVRIEHLYHREDLRMAVLGSAKECLVVVTDGEEAVLLDLTGGSRAAEYAERYLTSEGISSVQTLCLCDPSARGVRNYEKYLSFYKPETLLQMQAVSEDFPQFFDLTAETRRESEFLFHGAKIRVEAASAAVEYAGNTCLFAASAGALPESVQPEFLCVAGKLHEPLPDCGILLHADPGSPYTPDAHTLIGAPDAEITITQDGTCRLRRLYGEN